MGSGMLPPNAYVTFEHEYLLVFRDGPDRRGFEPGAARRYESASFWEERNRWFSDVRIDVGGTLQALPGDESRDCAAAYPFEIPSRLINMYSLRGDTVLDPFRGTGTTTLAAMVAARNSVGYEIDPDVAGQSEGRAAETPALSRAVVRERLDRHREFVRRRRADGESFAHEAERYGFPVATEQEREILFHAVTDVEATDDGYRAVHEPVTEGRGEGGPAGRVDP